MLSRLIISTILSFTFVTNAQATDTSPSPMATGGVRQQIRQEVREKVEERLEQRQEIRQEIRSNVAENHANRLTKRFDLYYQRFTNIIKRIETRIAALKANGKDTSTAESKLASAKTNLESAKTKGSEAIAAFMAIDPAKFSEQRQEALKARDMANDARKLFLQVHKDLVATIAELKKGSL